MTQLADVVEATTIRPFQVSTSEAELTELRRRINATRWLWADFDQSNTIVLAGMSRGLHKVLIELVDAEGNVFTAQTVTFHSPGKDVRP
jgi:hypothetical protein